ncbi:hypothetical protein EGR_08487 [Echinococcus granulosus]|uniref:Uncharacterized protein n=1 Tax=Echinococcus granulosus TaxID=6210 RepID=W6U8C5_ECHGR|nr:hypothetical protein EGR_08487 [Echinococcus granulosus]EUB56626.1 hypothetical protein EGR_08487 [Echinococcus granulosus]
MSEREILNNAEGWWWQWSLQGPGNFAFKVFFIAALVCAALSASAEIYVDSYDKHTFQVYVAQDAHKNHSNSRNSRPALTYETRRGFWFQEDRILSLDNQAWGHVTLIGHLYYTSRNLVAHHCDPSNGEASALTTHVVVAMLLCAIFLLLLSLLHLGMSLRRGCPMLLMLTLSCNCLFTALVVRLLRGLEMHACLTEHSWQRLPAPRLQLRKNISIVCFQETAWSLDTESAGVEFLFFRFSGLILIHIATALLFFSWAFGDKRLTAGHWSLGRNELEPSLTQSSRSEGLVATMGCGVTCSQLRSSTSVFRLLDRKD